VLRTSGLTPAITCRRPDAAVRFKQVRKRAAVTWPGRAGGYPTGPPTVPDVSNSLIRFVSIHTAGTVWITSKLTRPAGAELGYPSPVARRLLRRLVGSMSFPSVLPATRSARLRLPSGGSLGLHFPTLTGSMLSYDCPLPVSGRFTCRSRPDTLFASSVCVSSAGSWPLRSSYAHAWPTWSPGTPLPGSYTRRQGALPSSQVPPVRACPALRPRWSPRCSPGRAADCCLPLH
jgi:hypothetical protein